MFKSRLLILSFLLLTACQTVAPVLPETTRFLSAQSSTRPESPPIHLQIKRAEIAISLAELNLQFNHILQHSDEKRLRETQITTLEKSQMQLIGRIKPAALIPELGFKVVGELQARPGNVIRFHPIDIRVVGIPVKSLMDILGLELGNLAKFKDAWGRVVQSGNDIDLVLQKFTSDAIIEGQIKQIATDSTGITVIF